MFSYLVDKFKGHKSGYQVLKTIKSTHPDFNVEIRSYNKLLLAQVSCEGVAMREAMNKGFRDLAGFIFGGNTAVDKN